MRQVRFLTSLTLLCLIVPTFTWGQNATGGPGQHAQKCAALADLKLPDTTIIKAETVAAGAFAPARPFPEGPIGGFEFVPARVFRSSAESPRSPDHRKTRKLNSKFGCLPLRSGMGNLSASATEAFPERSTTCYWTQRFPVATPRLRRIPVTTVAPGTQASHWVIRRR